MEKNQGPIIDLFGDTARSRILNFLLLYAASSEYSKSEIARNSYVSWRSFNRVWPEIAKLRILVERRFGQSKLYSLNMSNPVTQLMLRLGDEMAFQSLGVTVPAGPRIGLGVMPQAIAPQIPITAADSVKLELETPSALIRPPMDDIWRICS